MADVTAPETIEQLQARLNKAPGKNGGFGAGTLVTLDNSRVAEINHWSSTGIYSLDEIMAWGLPGGRMVEFFGAESSGKTTAMMSSMIENDRNGGLNLAVDGEGTFDQDRYAQMGGDPSRVRMYYPKTLEEFYDVIKAVIKWANTQVLPSNALVLIGVDSLPTLIPKAMFELEGDEQLVAAASRVNSVHLPQLDKALGGNTCLLILNQIRDKIGSMAWTAEGNIDTPGGRIVKHTMSLRVLFNKAGQIDNGKTGDDRVITGIKTGAKVVKSKIGPPLRKTEFNIMFDHRGVDNVANCLEAFKSAKLVPNPVKGVFTMPSKETFTKDTFHNFLRTHPKWTTAALEKAFTLYHPDIDIRRYAIK